MKIRALAFLLLLIAPAAHALEILGTGPAASAPTPQPTFAYVAPTAVPTATPQPAPTLVPTATPQPTQAAGSSTIVQPQGRLTLLTGTPVLTSDQTAKATLYYDCYAGKGVPYYDGSSDAMDSIASCEVSTAMQSSSTGVLNSAGVFDVWWAHSGASRICVATDGSGGGWASDTAGSNTARGTGYSHIHNTRGYWTNVNAIASCYNGATNYGSIAADQATYLGTIYTTAAGQTGMAFKPAAAAGGSNPILGVWNAYNRVEVTSVVMDNTRTWSYNSTTPRASNASNSNRASYVDGLGMSSVFGTFNQSVLNANGGGASGTLIGMNLDSTSATPNHVGFYGDNTNSLLLRGTTVADAWAPSVGFHYVQEMEWMNTASSNALYGRGGSSGEIANDPQLQSMTVRLPM